MTTQDLTIIELSSEELQSEKLSSYNLEKALVGFEKDGIVVIKNGVDPDHLDSLNERMIPDAKKLYGDENTHVNFGKETGNIQQDPVPYKEYLHNDILANKFVNSITECILGPNPVVRLYSANTAFKATKRQPPHIDVSFPYNDHCFGICVNINLVSTNSENGATELWPGTHKMSKLVHGEVSDSLKESRRKECPPIQPSLPKGSIIIRDFRLWHAGMPNKTDDPRVMLVTVQFPAWYRSNLKIKLPKSAEEKINSFQKTMKIAAEYMDDDYNYLEGGHNFTFAQTY